MTFGEHIRATRHRKMLALRWLAGRLDVSPSYITDIEYDRRVPSEQVLRGLAEVLELDAEETICRAGRLGEDTERYLRRNPAAIRLMRRLAELDADEETLSRLLAIVEVA